MRNRYRTMCARDRRWFAVAWWLILVLAIGIPLVFYPVLMVRGYEPGGIDLIGVVLAMAIIGDAIWSLYKIRDANRWEAFPQAHSGAGWLDVIHQPYNIDDLN